MRYIALMASLFLFNCCYGFGQYENALPKYVCPSPEAVDASQYRFNGLIKWHVVDTHIPGKPQHFSGSVKAPRFRKKYHIGALKAVKLAGENVTCIYKRGSLCNFGAFMGRSYFAEKAGSKCTSKVQTCDIGGGVTCAFVLCGLGPNGK